MESFALSGYAGTAFFYWFAAGVAVVAVLLAYAAKRLRSRALWLAPVLGFGLAGVLVWIGVGTNRLEVNVTPDRFVIDAPIYSASIAKSDVIAQEARRIDFTQEPGLRAVSRTNGLGLPDFQFGWFDLASGEKALLVLTDESRAVYVPTRVGHAVIVSPTDPEALLEALQR